MKISGFGSVDSTSGTSKRRATSSTGSFADLLASAEASEASPMAHVSDVAATSALNNLLALQEISDEDVRRKKLLQRGNNLLDSLEQLRRRLLTGSLSQQLLVDIGRQLAVEKQTIMDPRINEIIEDIELRAAVELAKLQKAMEDKALSGEPK